MNSYTFMTNIPLSGKVARQSLPAMTRNSFTTSLAQKWWVILTFSNNNAEATNICLEKLRLVGTTLVPYASHYTYLNAAKQGGPWHSELRHEYLALTDLSSPHHECVTSPIEL